MSWPNGTRAGKNGGVYIVQGVGCVWVGESTDCVRRNEHLTRLGLAWKIVRRMPGSTRKERMRWESIIAQRQRLAGHTVVSNHDNEWMVGKKKSPASNQKRSIKNRGRPSWAKGRTVPAETRARISAANKATINSSPTELRRRSESARKQWESPAFRAKMIATHTGRKRSQETCDRISRAAQGRTPWNKRKRLQANK